MKRLLSAFIVIGLLLTSLTACAMKKFPASDFFSGSQLVLAQAIEHGDLPEVQQLAPVTDLNVPGRKDMTILFFAVQEALTRDPKQLEMITVLVKAGADPLQDVPDFGDVLGVVLNSSHYEFLRALLDAGVSSNTTTSKGTPIIFFVTREATFESLKLLIARGADVNRRDSLRNTPLYEALMNNALDQIDFLLAHGASPNTYNINGVSFSRALLNDIEANASAPNSITYKKLIEIRDRIIKMGVKWPPESPTQLRARWGDAEGWVDDSKHPLP
ncbi:ankyrin repeat domain-containing protein [Trinickia mobilis]|uniref:ankyrin repeat domain-containing protein n=1 Tax=Trinickia mobilis TaxID=2816356 RepID=UPI001A8D6D7F|nr:ankyrin repeat domain-containing protein [Trinickia mobilis]